MIVSVPERDYFKLNELIFMVNYKDRNRIVFVIDRVENMRVLGCTRMGRERM